MVLIKIHLPTPILYNTGQKSFYFYEFLHLLYIKIAFETKLLKLCCYFIYVLSNIAKSVFSEIQIQRVPISGFSGEHLAFRGNQCWTILASMDIVYTIFRDGFKKYGNFHTFPDPMLKLKYTECATRRFRQEGTQLRAKYLLTDIVH